MYCCKSRMKYISCCLSSRLRVSRELWITSRWAFMPSFFLSFSMKRWEWDREGLRFLPPSAGDLELRKNRFKSISTLRSGCLCPHWVYLFPATGKRSVARQLRDSGWQELAPVLLRMLGGCVCVCVARQGLGCLLWFPWRLPRRFSRGEKK